jgi:hypothetical protein
LLNQSRGLQPKAVYFGGQHTAKSLVKRCLGI